MAKRKTLMQRAIAMIDAQIAELEGARRKLIEAQAALEAPGKTKPTRPGVGAVEALRRTSGQ